MLVSGAIAVVVVAFIAGAVNDATGAEVTNSQVRVGLAAVGADAWLVAVSGGIATALLTPFPPAGRGIAAVVIAGGILAIASGAATPQV